MYYLLQFLKSTTTPSGPNTRILLTRALWNLVMFFVIVEPSILRQVMQVLVTNLDKHT